MSNLYLLIGGNQGDRQQMLTAATDSIRERIGSVVACSQIYETDPWGTFDSTETLPFLNMALKVETPLGAHECLRVCLDIERQLGRRRGTPEGTQEGARVYSSRPIDIDLILMDDEVIDLPDLTIPHPRMHERRFVLQPLNDIAPTLVHPVLKKSISQLLLECEDYCTCCVYC
ncbi:MAG: 2-amino-4-hydroxy-6-hydroxymethyldihydropteridine diphosphokinase [Bacteroidales bacterium]|nr:2-amino-4-hydroxy-6-hydroxymethyldihydropteridine diphosphokinase [Bacteroidales bacterium]